MKSQTKRIKKLLLFSALLLIILKLFLSFFIEPKEIDERVYLPIIFSEAISFSDKTSDKLYEARDSYDDVIGYCFNSYDLAPEVKGYAGPIKLFIGMDKSATIKDVSIIAHNETKLYMQKLLDDKFLGQFRLKSAASEFKLDNDIDGVTHATVSAKAIADSVRKSAVMVANSRLNMNIPIEEEEGVSTSEAINTLILLFITVSSLVIFMRKRANTFSSMKKKGMIITGYRDLILISVFLFVGLYKSSPLSITNIINIFYMRLPDFNNIFFYLLIGSFFIITLLFGRVYCGYLCPFSALIEFIEKIKTKKIRTYDHDLVTIKYIFLWAILVLVFYFDRIEISSYEPYLALFSSNASIFMSVALVLILLFTLFHRRIWCRYFCAVGAFTSLITKFAPFKTKPPKSCDSCGACNAVCPVEIDFTDITEFALEECIACLKCHEFCVKRSDN
ncbi:4Fe-4S binding protein [Thermodesulfobacteriota bacterium]